MSNRLSNYTGNRYTFTIGEIAARGDLADDLAAIDLKFANNTSFMSGNDIGNILADFTDKKYISNIPASGDLEGDFITTITTYWNLRRGDYYNMYGAITKNYDPIANYNMEEKGIDGRKIDSETDVNIRTGSATAIETPSGSRTVTTTKTGGTTTTETPEGSEKVTTTPSGSYAETVTKAGGETTTNTESRTTYDDATTFKDAVKNVTNVVPNTGNEEKTDHTFDQYKTEEETTFTQRKTTTDTSFKSGTQDTETETFSSRQTSNTTTYNSLTDSRTVTPGNTQSGVNAAGSVVGAHEVNEHYFKREGNIGVTTSQQMITSELELRYKYNLKYMFIREFLTRFTF